MNYGKYLIIFIMVSSITPILGQTNLGLFDNHTDIGDCKNKGFASYDEEE